MLEANELRKGVTFELDGELYRVLDYKHIKMARGGATIRTRLRNLRSGATIDKTFNSGDRVQDVRLERHEVQYLYRDGDLFYFMNTETYEQPALPASLIGNYDVFLTENMTLHILMYDTEAIDLELPVTVEMEVTEAEPGVAGDTAQGATKQVVTSTGLKVQTPLFVNVGDTIRVDTRDGNYLTRV